MYSLAPEGRVLLVRGRASSDSGSSGSNSISKMSVNGGTAASTPAAVAAAAAPSPPPPPLTLQGDHGGEATELVELVFPRFEELDDEDGMATVVQRGGGGRGGGGEQQYHVNKNSRGAADLRVSPAPAATAITHPPRHHRHHQQQQEGQSSSASDSPLATTDDDDSETAGWLHELDEALKLDSPPTSDYSDGGGGAGAASKTLPRRLAADSERNDSSANAIAIPLDEAARSFQHGTVPPPIQRESTVTTQRSTRGAVPIPQIHRPTSGLPSPSPPPPSTGSSAPPAAFGQVRRIIGQRPQQQQQQQQLSQTRNGPAGPGFGPGRGRGPPLTFRGPPSSQPQNIEIRIDNIPQGSKIDELYRLLGDVALHRYPFSRHDWKLNFWLHLPKAKPGTGTWGQINDGHGFLTLPTLDFTRKFLAKYGTRGPGSQPEFAIRPSHAKQPLKFSPGQRTPAAGILEWLNRVPYPEKGDRSQRMVNDKIADGLVLSRLEFGVLCRDGVFSPEYVKLMRDAKFSFDYRFKTFRILLVLEGKAAGSAPPITRSVVVKSSSVRLILASVSEGEYSATLIMHHAPAYEELAPGVAGAPSDGTEGGDGATESSSNRVYNGRRRKASFDADHRSTAAFTSRVIRLVFESESHRNNFEDLLAHIGCPNAKYVRLEDESRRVYSSSKRKAVGDWLESMESRAVAFQLARLYQNNLLVPKEIMQLRPTVERVYAQSGPFILADVLHQYVEEMTRLEDRWLDRIQRDKGLEDQDLAQNVSVTEVLEAFVARGLHRVDWRENYNSPVMQCLHVVLTPTAMILEGPYPDQSNRPLRKYGHHDHFVRVAFMDEDREQYYWDHDIDWTAFLDERVGAILRSGIRLGGRRYEFLGYSMSSLRNRSTWFCTPFEWNGIQVTADYIRANLGDFERVKRQPARYGARMAQAFTATDPSLVLKPEQIDLIEDVEREYRGETVCFTDGVGKISMPLARKVWTALHNGMEPADILPSAFQFRLGGYKGVLTVDSELEGEKICVRPSQQKFDAPDSLGLEIAYSYCRHMYMFLNRPLIKVLEDLQVPHQVFLDLLRDAVQKAEELKQYVRETRRQLTLHGLGGPYSVTDIVENIAALLKTNKIEPFKEGGHLTTFVAESLEFAEVHILRMLKLKARIPVTDAHVGVAVADESGVLKPGEIYALRHNPGEPPQVVEGDVLLVRAPTVDVGDVQFAKAVGTPPPGAERFKHLPNVVIFSVQGTRPLLTSLARGDMDGDLVGVISDRRLFPRRTEPPMQHKPKTPVDLDYDCTINEVIDFVLRFFRNDILGSIASRHLLIADQAPSGYHEGCGTRHPSCKKLAELQTVAVDAPKSGQSIDLQEIPRPLFPHRPDFLRHDQQMAKNDGDDQLIYHSQKILGKLYRAIRLSSREEDNQILKESPRLDNQYIPAGENDHVLMALIEEFDACGLDTSLQPTDVEDRESAWYAMHTYASDLRHIAWSNTMTAGHPLSEHELFIGTILHGPLAAKSKQELVQRINLQCKELIDGVLCRLEGQDGRDRPQMWTNRVLAALRVAVSQGTNFGAPTFGMVVIKSALYLLALMKDVRQADHDMPAASAAPFEYNEDEPFEPVLTLPDPAMPAVPAGDGDLEGVFTAPQVQAEAPVVIQADTGGEAAHWNDKVIVTAE